MQSNELIKKRRGFERSLELEDLPFSRQTKQRPFLTGQSWRVLKSGYTAGSPEQGFRRCFADGVNQSLHDFVCAQATYQLSLVCIFPFVGSL